MSDDELWARLPNSDGIEKFRILIQLSQNKSHESEHLQALAYAQQASDYAESIGSEREHGHALHMAGYLHYLLNNYDDAVACYTKASEIMHSYGIDSDTARIEGSIGESFWQTEDYLNAAMHYEIAHKLYSSVDDYSSASVAARDYADSMLRLGRLQEAQDWFNKAVEHAKKSRDSHRLYRAYRGLARVGLFKADGLLAVEFATKALTVAGTCSCRHCMPDSNLLLGQAHILNGNPKMGAAYVDIANTTYREYNAMQMQAYCEYEFGNAALAQHDYRKAQEHLDQAMLFSEMIEEQIYAHKVRVTYGLLHIHRNNISEATIMFAQAYDIANGNSYLRSLKHRMLPSYLEALELTNQGQTILHILNEIQDETDPWLLSTYYRMSYSARAHMLLGNKNEALRDADGALILNSDDIPDDCTASLHLTRAEILKDSDPRTALSEAQKAISYYIHCGDYERAEYLARTWVVEPDRRHRQQVIAEQNRNKYEEIFGDNDPIIQQVHDEHIVREKSADTGPQEELA